MSKTFVGSRLRQLRTERGLSQVALAKTLELSPSYLNQIEHDVRPLTVPVLLRISEEFGVDATFFSPQDSTRLIAEMREVLMDEHVYSDTGTDSASVPEASELAQVASTHPQVARAMVSLHQRYRNATDQIGALTEGRNGTAYSPGVISMPHEEVRDYFYRRQNYLHELDTAAEDMTQRLRLHRGDVLREIAQRLENVHDVRIVKRIDLGENMLHHYDPDTRTMEFAAQLLPGQRAFRMAAELAFLEYGDMLERLADEGNFSSAEARSLGIKGLANYFAAATVLPYRQFHDAAEDFRYDIERLSTFFSAGFETICHRLSTMQRPDLRGVPFSFVRVDRAGNMSKRQSATGFHFNASGGTCPLWSVYETFAEPGKIVRQVAQMPDGRNYLWVARTVTRRPARYGEPGKTFAIGLGCELRHAHRTVYGDGLDLTGAAATPIGSGCRVCERVNCPQRAFPQIGKDLDLDEHRSTVSPYSVR